MSKNEKFSRDYLQNVNYLDAYLDLETFDLDLKELFFLTKTNISD